MYSADGEFVKFTRDVICEGPVEEWLKDIGKYIEIIEKYSKFKFKFLTQKYQCVNHLKISLKM